MILNLKYKFKNKMTTQSLTFRDHPMIKRFDFDSENNLELYCYTECDVDSPDIVKYTRGVIYQNDNIVMDSIPFTPDFTTQDVSSIKFDGYRFFESVEGTLLRVFNINGKWFLSTHRKLDAYRSRWASRFSFGELFETVISRKFESLNAFYNTLDVSKQYVFLLLNTQDSKIVCDPPVLPTVLHIGTYTNHVFDLDDNINLDKPKELFFTSVEELIDFVNNCNWHKIQGVMAFGDQPFKVVHPEYKKLAELRGREKSVLYRYLQIRLDEENVSKFIQMYPEYSEKFQEYEHILHEISTYIHYSYIGRYVNKKFVRVPPEHFTVMKAAQEWHMSNKKVNRVTLERIKKIMNNQTCHNLNQMIKYYQKERKNSRKETVQLHRQFYSPAPVPLEPTEVPKINI